MKGMKYTIINVKLIHGKLSGRKAKEKFLRGWEVATVTSKTRLWSLNRVYWKANIACLSNIFFSSYQFGGVDVISAPLKTLIRE